MNRNYDNNFLNSQNYIFGNTEKQKILSKLFIEISIRNFLSIASNINKILNPRVLIVLLYLLIIISINIVSNDSYGTPFNYNPAIPTITFVFILFFIVSFTIKNNYTLNNLKDFFLVKEHNIFIVFLKAFVLFFLFIKYIDFFFWSDNGYVSIYYIIFQILFIIPYIYGLFLFLFKCNVINVFLSLLIMPYIVIKGLFLYLYIKILGITKYYFFIKKTPFKHIKQAFIKLDYSFTENDKYSIKIKSINNNNTNNKSSTYLPNINNNILRISKIFIKIPFVLNIIFLPINIIILLLNNWNFSTSNNLGFLLGILVFSSFGIIGNIIFEKYNKKINSKIILSIGCLIMFIYLYILYKAFI